MSGIRFHTFAPLYAFTQPWGTYNIPLSYVSGLNVVVLISGGVVALLYIQNSLLLLNVSGGMVAVASPIYTFHRFGVLLKSSLKFSVHSYGSTAELIELLMKASEFTSLALKMETLSNPLQLAKAPYFICDTLSRFMSFSSVQLRKALSPIVVTEAGNVMDFSLEQLENVWYPTEVSDSGNVTDARELHPEKTELSRAVIELGIITDVNPVQFEKARVPICVIVPGKYMEVSLEQLRKASSPMDSSVLGMAMTAKLEQLKKAWSPIDVSKFGKCREINPVQL